MSEEKGELDLLREKIAVARQQGADLEPERKALGLTLKNIFEERIQDNRQQQENLSENIQKKGKEMRFFSFSYTKQGRVFRNLLTSGFVIYS